MPVKDAVQRMKELGLHPYPSVANFVLVKFPSDPKLNAEAALFALEHADEFARQAAILRAERERLHHALAAMPGVTPFPSEANMILVRVPDAKRCFDGMKARGVLVKNVSALHPLLTNCLRLTVGTPDENTLMIDALKASLT